MLKFVLFGFKFGKFVHYPIIKKNFELIKIISKQEKREKKEVSEIIRKADAITIATPPLEQKNIFNEAFVQKKHIFFEKPLGFMPKKKIKIKKNQALMTSYIFPEIDVWKKLKYFLSKKYFGKIYYVQINWLLKSYVNKLNIKSWKTSLKKKGGALNNFAPHVFNYVEFFFGKIKSVHIIDKTYIKNKVTINLRLTNNIFINVCLDNNSLIKPVHSISIYGSKYNCVLSNQNKNIVNNFKLVIFNKNKIIKTYKSKLKKNIYDERIKPMESLYKKFYLWIKYKKIQKPNFNDALRTELLIYAALKSIKLKKKINIS